MSTIAHIDLNLNQTKPQTQKLGSLILIRHGQSTWNLENRFTGWVDVDLTDTGIAQAKQAAQLLSKHGLQIDIAYTSYLKRAVRTLWHVLDEMNSMHIDTVHAWQLNERHYGGLTGLNKAEVAKQYGDEQVHIWRRSYDIAPSDLLEGNPYYAELFARYGNSMPKTESLKSTIERVIPYWNEHMHPRILKGENVCFAGHGNSIRALMKYLSDISEQAILELNIANGQPIVYQFNGQANYQVLV